jgi:hypothetical protein
MKGISRQIEDPRARLSSLRHTPQQVTSGTMAKRIDHNEEGAVIQLGKQRNILFRESLSPQYKEDRSMIYGVGVKSIYQIDKELGGNNTLSALLSKETIQLGQLAHCVTISTETLLRVVNQPKVLCGPIKALINDFQEERQLCAIARNWSKITNFEGAQFFRDVAGNGTGPFMGPD